MRSFARFLCLCRALTRHARRSTILDGGREWIEAQEKQWPALADALRDGAAMHAARERTKLWSRAWELRVSELRASPALRKQMGRSHVHRTAVSVTRALVANNETFRTFLSEPLDGLQRWQMFMILITLLISQLLVNSACAAAAALTALC